MEDIKNLSMEEKIELIEAIREKRERIKKEKSIYKPNEGQRPVHTSKTKFRYVFSGNGAGKTCLGANEAIWWSLGYNPVTEQYTKVPARGVIVLDNPKKIGEQWIPELRKWAVIKDKWMKKDGKPYVSRIQFPNGSEILFASHDQSDLAWEGIELSFAIYDEPPPRHMFIAITRGGRMKDNPFRSLLVGTPISCAWLRTEIYEPWVKGELKNVECFRTGTEVNASNLPEDYFTTGFGQFLTEEEKKIRFEGQFYDLGSLALAHLLNKKLHIIDKERFSSLFNKKSDPCVVAIDPHSSKPHHAVLLGANREGNLFYIKEIKDKSVARRFAQVIKKWYSGYRVVDIICDSAGKAEMTSGEGYKSFIEVLRSEGIPVRPTSFKDKSDEDFIDRIRSVLAVPDKPNNFGFYTPKLSIVEGNPGIIRNIENVGWQKDRSGEIKDKLDISSTDYLSCLKYGLASGISNKKGNERKQRYTKATYGFGRKTKKL